MIAPIATSSFCGARSFLAVRMSNSEKSFLVIVSAITPPLGMPKTIEFFLSSSYLIIFFSASPKMFAAVVLSLNLS